MSNQAVAGFRLSIQQDRIWSQHVSEDVPLWSGCELVLEGPLDVAKLRGSIQAVVARHEILRTVFHRQTGIKVPFQVIQETADYGWRVEDLRSLGPEMQDDKIGTIVRECQTLFNYESGPALHAMLARTRESRHTLVLSIPALCGDRRSLDIVSSEIIQRYGDKFDPTEQVMQYADIAEWQQELLTSEESKPARDYWRDYCKKIDFSALPTAFSGFERKRKSEFRPEVVTLGISRKSVEGFEDKALPGIFLAGWVAFLSRITSRPSVTVGCQFDGRSYSELTTAVGWFAKNLPVNGDCSEGTTFSTLLKQVDRDVTDFRNWQDSFSWTNAGLPSGQEQGPTLPFSFEWREVPAAEMAAGVRLSMVREEVCAEQFRLRLVVLKHAESLDLEFAYDAGSVERERVERLSRSYEVLFQQAVAKPETAISRLPLLGEPDRQALVVDWNQTASTYPRQKCVHQLFESQAGKSPNAPAVRFQDDCLTYGELNARANQLAHYLHDKGVGANSLVALCMDRSTNMMAAVLAVLKAGGAYVPLSAEHPKPRLAQQLAGAVALVTEAKFECLLPSFDGPVILVDQHKEQWSNHPAANPEAVADPESYAYVIYTSGSTGTPKGVAVRHRNLVNYTTFIQDRLELATISKPLHFATVSTLGADLGNTCIYPSLTSGGCLHVIASDVAADSQRLRDYASKYPIDVLKIVPSHLMALLNSGGGREVLPRKYLILGGEAFTVPLLEKIIETGGGCELLNHYGPTETTVGSLTLRLKDFDWQNSPAQTIPIGKPIANTRVYVLDGYGEPVPIGVPGELYIAGDGVTAGYIGQPSLTAERFVSERFGSDPAAKMYRTGDLVRYLPDGNIEFLGRVDDQVKIRGFRIELGEIEAVLLQHAGVKQAAVLALSDNRGEKSLVAYVVGSTPGDDLRIYLRGQLPDYMVPSAIIKLPKLPLNANGKIDRQALPKPEDVETQKKETIVPRTPSEEVVAAIWAEVLKREDIGVEDNFFEIGGHSLLATQIASRLREHFHTPVPVRAVFESPSIADLAKRMDRSRREEQGLIPPPIIPVPRNGDLPLSFAQERLWVLDQLEPNNPLYNIPRTLRLRGPLQVDALERSINEIVKRHESQRTSFATKDGQPVQVIAKSLEIPLGLEDLAKLEESSRKDEACRRAVEESLRPFDLTKPPLLRAHLLRLAPEDHVLLLTMHHIISDAWSAGIFLQELTTLYDAFRSGRPSPLPEQTLQYADYAAQERAWLQGEVLEKQLAFWRERLKGVPPVLDLPVDRERPTARTFAGACEMLHVPVEKLRALKELTRQEGATLFMALTAIFQTLLSKYSGQEQIVVGTDLANRTMPETETMIGFFINLLPVRTDLSGNPTFRELLGRVRDGLLESYAHQEVPFPKIVMDIQPERSATHNPIVQVLFVMQNIPRARRELAGLQVEPFEVPVSTSKFDMAVFVLECPDGLHGYWIYSTELFERTTIERMLRHFVNLIDSAVSQPDARLSSLPMLSPEELAQQEAEKHSRKQSQFKKLKATAPAAVGLAGDQGAEHPS